MRSKWSEIRLLGSMLSLKLLQNANENGLDGKINWTICQERDLDVFEANDKIKS